MCTMFVLAVNVLLLLLGQSQAQKTAYVVLYGDLSNTVHGTLTFTQDNANANVHITGSITGLSANAAHGFHVHVYAVSDGSPNCNASGPHFNPYNTTHGPRTANITARHVGDLGNITTDVNGKADLNIYDGIIHLYNATQSILNRTIVVHLSRDDGGMGGFADSATTGNAGARIVCGLIRSSNKAFNVKPLLSLLWMTIAIILFK